MRNDRLNYVLVGGFVLAMLAATVVSIALLTGRTGPTDTYYTSYEDATGLKFGSQVLYMGYPVGQVTDIRPVLVDGQLRFELELAVAQEFRRWSVPRDSVAEVRAAGLLAAVTVDIRAGSSNQPLEPGDRIRGVERADVFGAVSDTARVVRELTLGTIRPLLENLDRHVGAFGNVLESKGGPLVENLNRLAAQLADRAPEIIAEFLVTTTDLRRVSTRLAEVLSEGNAAKVDGVLDHVLAASEDLAALSSNARRQLDAVLAEALVARIDHILMQLDTTVGQAATAVGQMSRSTASVFSPENVERVERVIANADEASASVRRMVGPRTEERVLGTLAQLSRAAGDVGGLVSETRGHVAQLLGPDTADKVQQALANVSRASAEIARLSTDLGQSLDAVLTPDVAEKLARALQNFASASANVARLSRRLDGSRAELEALLSTLAASAQENRGDLRDAARDLQYSLRTVSEHIDAVAENLEGTSRNMFEFSRRIRANPGALLRGGTPLDEAVGVDRRSGG